jgi:hypothetical protein|tara:strand:- start:967 stop:1209 length:243 start_codon:yes stop_codon:yes gene_type:complete
MHTTTAKLLAYSPTFSLRSALNAEIDLAQFFTGRRNAPIPSQTITPAGEHRDPGMDKPNTDPGCHRLASAASISRHQMEN